MEPEQGSGGSQTGASRSTSALATSPVPVEHSLEGVLLHARRELEERAQAALAHRRLRERVAEGCNRSYDLRSEVQQAEDLGDTGAR